MDQGLFGKYKVVLTKRQTIQDEIIAFIEQETGIILTAEEMVIEKHTIAFHVSSVKKVMLRKKSIEEFFAQKKYTIKW